MPYTLDEHLNYSIVRDVLIKICLYLTPDELKIAADSFDSIKHVFNSKEMREYYLSRYFFMPRTTGAKEYVVTIDVYTKLLIELANENKLSDMEPSSDKYVKVLNQYQLVTKNDNKLNRNVYDLKNLVTPYLSGDERLSHILEHIVKYVFDKHQSIADFDPIRYGDFVNIINYLDVQPDSDNIEKEGFAIFIIEPNSHHSYSDSEYLAKKFYSIKCDMFFSSYIHKIPFEIVLGAKYPINYYHILHEYECKLDITSIRDNILSNIIQAKHDEDVYDMDSFVNCGDKKFAAYLNFGIDHIIENFGTCPFEEADSAHIKVESIIQTMRSPLNIRIGHEYYEGNESKEPRFRQIIQKYDMVYGCVTSQKRSDRTIDKSDYCDCIIALFNPHIWNVIDPEKYLNAKIID